MRSRDRLAAARGAGTRSTPRKHPQSPHLYCRGGLNCRACVPCCYSSYFPHPAVPAALSTSLALPTALLHCRCRTGPPLCRRAPHLSAAAHDLDPTRLHALDEPEAFWAAFRRRYGDTNPHLVGLMRGREGPGGAGRGREGPGGAGRGREGPEGPGERRNGIKSNSSSARMSEWR